MLYSIFLFVSVKIYVSVAKIIQDEKQNSKAFKKNLINCQDLQKLRTFKNALD